MNVFEDCGSTQCETIWYHWGQKAFVDTVSEQMVAGDKITIVGFGTFEVSERAAREGRNPKTGEAMPIPASKVPRFKAGKGLKDAVNGK